MCYTVIYKTRRYPRVKRIATVEVYLKPRDREDRRFVIG